MLSQLDVACFVEARHGDAFAGLGMHADAAGKLWLRAMLPGAAPVASGKPFDFQSDMPPL